MTKQEKTKQNETKHHPVTIVIILSDEEQIDAARQKATATAGIEPNKMVAIGTPKSTRDGLRVEFGVK